MSRFDRCQKDVGAIVTMGGGDNVAASMAAAATLVRVCNVCGARLADTKSEEPQLATVVALPTKTTPRPSTRQTEPQIPQAQAPGDILGMVRARLTWLDAEIARLNGLETEAKRLRKMLAAADRAHTVRE